MTNWKNKVAIVTGSSRGLGKAVVKLLARNGVSVIVNYSSNKQHADEVVNEIMLSGGQAYAIQADVSKPAEITKLFNLTIEKYGKIDIVINNSGIMVTKLTKDTSEEDFDRTFSINAKSVFFSMKEAATKLADNGRIINISSSVTRVMFPTYGAYSASKAAVEQMTRVFAKEVGSRGVTANTVSPGPINTELFMHGKTEADIQRIGSMTAFNRIGETQDIAPLILFLASDESYWITGQNLGINGGMV
ncbi:SDR family oxidoreductase [Sphingobacterium tabacisoli]|uniref:SDR family oxidoreductase n=2 Tax=Sphingobacterium tabacisoli TaxID=2044855 RepID=A0ABW5L200_9SPHI